MQSPFCIYFACISAPLRAARLVLPPDCWVWSRDWGSSPFAFPLPTPGLVPPAPEGQGHWSREHGPCSHSRNVWGRQEKAGLHPSVKTEGSDEGNHSSTSHCTKRVEEEKLELSLSCIPCPALQDKTLSFTSLLCLSSTSGLSRGFANPQNTLHQRGETQQDLESRRIGYKNQLLRGLVRHS